MRLARAAWSRSSACDDLRCATSDGRLGRAAIGTQGSRATPNGDFRTCACPPGRVTISRSISASTATTSWERSTRSPMGASGWWTSPRSTAACSSTTHRSVSTPNPSSARGTATPSSERSPRRCRRCSAPAETRSTCAYRRPAAREDSAVLPAGMLGITALGASAGRDGEKRVQQWSAASFEVRSESPVAAGIDGEALKLDPPLRFRTRPQALRVRIAPQHPGAPPRPPCPKARGARSVRSPTSRRTVLPSAGLRTG